jgi:SSS family solute:Na+ symporter
LWQRAYAGKSAKSVRKAVLIGAVLVVCFEVMAILLGIYGHIILSSTTSNNVVPDLLRAVAPAGLYGLLLSGFFAAVMSSADSMLLISSMTIVHDFYQKYLGRKVSDKKMLKISRWVTVALGVLALTIAIVSSSLVHLAIESVSFYVALLPAIVFGFYWKKATAGAAFWSILAGTLAITVFLFIDKVVAFIPGIIVSFGVFVAIALWQSRSTKSQ